MFGASGSNECPAGSVWIETEAACRTAVAATGRTIGSAFAFVATYPDYPRGCYYGSGTNAAWFNPHAVGAGVYGYQLLCATVTIGAPQFQPMRASAAAHT